MALYRSGEDPFAWDPKKEKPKRQWFKRHAYHGKHRPMKGGEKRDLDRIQNYLDAVSNKDAAA